MHKRNWTHHFFFCNKKVAYKRLFFLLHFSSIEHSGCLAKMILSAFFFFGFVFVWLLILTFVLTLRGHITICDVDKRLLLYSRQRSFFVASLFFCIFFLYLFVCLFDAISGQTICNWHNSWFIVNVARSYSFLSAIITFPFVVFVAIAFSLLLTLR